MDRPRGGLDDSLVVVGGAFLFCGEGPRSSVFVIVLLSSLDFWRSEFPFSSEFLSSSEFFKNSDEECQNYFWHSELLIF